MHRLFTLLSIDNATSLDYNTVDLRYMKGKRFFCRKIQQKPEIEQSEG